MTSLALNNWAQFVHQQSGYSLLHCIMDILCSAGQISFYGKYPKILNTLSHTFFCLYFFFFSMHLVHKILGGNTNTVDLN